jgi:integrase
MTRKPAKPVTPRGVEPRLRRAKDGAWVWRYRVRWTDPTSRTRKAEEFNTVDEALDFWSHLRLARGRGALEDLTRGEITLTAFVEESWWPKYAANQLEHNTLKTYAPVWNRHLAPRVGHIQLRHLTAPVVQQLRENMEADRVGAPTVRRALAILQSICRYAVTAGELKTNPVREVRKPAVTRQLAIVAISPAQVEKLRALFLNGYVEMRDEIRDGRMIQREIEHPPDSLSATLVSLMAYEGLRPEEALALEDRHERQRTLLLEQKNVDGKIVIGQKTCGRRSRTHRSPELFSPVRRDLLEHKLALRRSPNCTLLFPRPDGQPWRETDYRNWRSRVFKPAVRVSGLPITRPYDLRHACASLLIQAGWPLTRVAEHLGHSVGTLSTFYAHLIADLADADPIPPTDQILLARGELQDREKGSG